MSSPKLDLNISKTEGINIDQKELIFRPFIAAIHLLEFSKTKPYSGQNLKHLTVVEAALWPACVACARLL